MLRSAHVYTNIPAYQKVNTAPPFNLLCTGKMFRFTHVVQVDVFGAVSGAYNWTEQANLRSRLEDADLGEPDDDLSLGMCPHLLLMHDAARAYAAGVVGLSYVDDNAVSEDAALQAFAWDLCAEGAGNIQGLCWGGRTQYGQDHGYPEGPAISTRVALSELLEDAVSAVFIGHSLPHSRFLAEWNFIPLAPFNVRPNMLPTPDSVCVAGDLVNTFGDSQDWASHVTFMARILSPTGGHIGRFSGHYSTDVNGDVSDDPLAPEKNDLYDAFVDTLEGPLREFDTESGSGVWPQLGNWMYL